MTSPHVFDRLDELISARRSTVCVGLDPHPDRLPNDRPGTSAIARWRGFLFDVLEAVAGVVPAVKPQVAFFEQMGPDGYSLYFELIREARRLDLFVIGDVKRGDIGSTAGAYAEAHLGGPEALAADAITVNPYLGRDGVLPFLDVARRRGRGIFALLRTSNPSSAEIQEHGAPSRPLFRRVAELLDEWGAGAVGRRGYSDVGAVVGATHPEEAAELRRILPRTFFLVPGFGAQGAGPEDVAATFDAQGSGALISSSRGILFAGESRPDVDPVEAARDAAIEMSARLRDAWARPR